MTAPGPIAPGELDAGRRLRRAIDRTLRRSLHVRHLDAGSCNGCDWEIAALLNPFHDGQRLGYRLRRVAAPRPDCCSLTGTMTAIWRRAAGAPTRRCPIRGSWSRSAPARHAAGGSPAATPAATGSAM